MGRLTVLRLLRYPGSLLAVAAASAILAAVSASAAPFLSSTSGATLHRLIEQDAALRLPTVAVWADSTVAADVIDYRTSLLERELGPILGEPIVTARGDTVIAVSEAGRERQVRIVTRTGFLQHVERVEGGEQDGVWIADVTARELHVGPGDRLRIRSTFTESTTMITGVYADLLTAPRDPYWSVLGEFIFPRPGDDTRPPPFLLMDLATYTSLEERLGDSQDAMVWEFRLPTAPMSIEQSERLVAGLGRFRSAIANTSRDVGAAFRRSTRDEPLAGWVSSAKEITEPVSAPVNTLAVAGRGIALAALIGSGVFMMRRRRVEVAILDARGVGPVRFGLRAMVEVALPVAGGSIAGTAVALWLIDAIGPGGPIGEDSLGRALTSVVWTALVGVVLLGVVAARSLVAGRSLPPVARWTSRVPWDVLLLAGAVGALVWLGSADDGSTDSTSQLDPIYLVVPLLLVTGAAGLAARGLRVALPRLRRWGGRSGAGTYLATRRLAAAPASATWLLVASAVAVGTLIYAGTLSASLGQSATQEAALAVGSDTAVAYSGTIAGVDTAPFPATPVDRIEAVSFAAGSDADLDVLLVDPRTFSGAAYWRREYSRSSLDELMAAIAEPASEGPRAIVAGPLRVPEDPILSLPGFDVPIEVVGRAGTFPGIVGARPMLVVDREAMRTAAEAAGLSLDRFVDEAELWARTAEEETRAFVASAGATPLSSTALVELRDTPRYLAVTAVLEFLLALGVLASGVVLIAVTLYLQSRQRRSETAYALARRMGLTGSDHLRSIALEVAALLGGALVVGAALAVAASWLVNDEVQARAIDVDVALFRFPAELVMATAAVLLASALVAAGFAQWRAERSDVGEVMRVAE